MKKLPMAVIAAGIIGLPFAGTARAEDTPEHSFTGKVGLFTEYEYRGISQTSEKPALQLNLDYAHKSGFYLGTFLSNIKWLKDTAEVNGFSTNANVEWDIYGGYKFEVVKDVTLDVGYLRYEYPRSGEFNPKPNTDEVYVGASWGPLSAKYSYSFNDTFGVPDSKGSDYIELDYNQPLAMISDKLTFNGVLGHQRYKGTQIHEFHNGDLSYTVWKAGATYDFGSGFNAGAYVKGTDAHHDLYTIKGKDWSKSRLVAFVTYSF
ncbi:MAG TPA: TorF family putative porin [Usitatibacter sp.]|nr:TorF family putative porin [Usitatibacter sp.]